MSIFNFLDFALHCIDKVMSITIFDIPILSFFAVFCLLLCVIKLMGGD